LPIMRPAWGRLERGVRWVRRGRAEARARVRARARAGGLGLEG